MKLIKIKFENTKQGKARYEISTQSVITTKQMIQTDVWESVISLLDKLKAIGTEAKEKVGPLILYDLKPAGGTVALTDKELRLLLAFVETSGWRPSALKEVSGVRKWLKAFLPKEAKVIPFKKPLKKKRRR